MYRENIDNMIMESRKQGDSIVTIVYQAIKNEYLKQKTAKNAKLLDDDAEIFIIRKMIKERKESADMYMAGNRPELAQKEMYEASILEKLLPAGPSEEEIRAKIEEYIASVEEFSRKHMGPCIKFVKIKLSGVDGKELSALVQTYF